MTNAQRYIHDDRENEVFRVHRSVFVEQEIYEREKKLVFDRSWLYVGHESELPKPNDFLTRKVAGRETIFNRDGKGKIHVLLNTCRHRGAQACRERCGNQKVFVCFYHGWGYDGTGALVTVPDGETGYSKKFDRKQLGLHEPRHASYRGFVFVTFSAEAPSLEEYLGPATRELDFVADQSENGMQVVAGVHHYAMNANWKLLVENSIDGYHGLPVHQTYAEMMMNLGVTPGLIDSTSGGSFGAATDLGNGHTVIASPQLGVPLMNDELLSLTRARRARIAERLGERHAHEMLEKGRNRLVFPSFIVVDLNFGIQLRTMYPTGPDRTEIVGWQLMPGDVSEAMRRYRIDNALTFWGPAGLATPDDVEALEQCQRGFTSATEVEWSDISRGMASKDPRAVDELQMRVFWRQWNHLLTGEEPSRREGPEQDLSYLAQTPKKAGGMG